MSYTTLVTGANRGIGLEFVRQYLADGHRVIACCRQPEQADELQALAEAHPSSLDLVALDLSDPAQLIGLKAYLGNQSIDLLISNAGLYGPKGVAFGNVSEADFAPVMAVNVLAPLLLVQTLADNLSAGAKVALLSSKMGSIADNGSGGSYLYRASKAALNAIGKSLSVDLAPQQVSVALLHPGWVQTAMGGPNALISTQTSVRGMRQVLSQLDLSVSGRFFNYDGNEIPW
ncbi:SDR family oxidoreductase [Ferrimonas balearica]|uniref:SDR family oxidoreductase n=1 Tax=Ferrimonas balearica TaxID=44012 RepID=UPI001C946330|nr:SDR family oxidoreductase [Ferrimonas balearica]MBY6106897.1 SDR family oxidoreductase [Ferrimonas balearica]